MAHREKLLSAAGDTVAALGGASGLAAATMWWVHTTVLVLGGIASAMSIAWYIKRFRDSCYRRGEFRSRRGGD